MIPLLEPARPRPGDIACRQVHGRPPCDGEWRDAHPPLSDSERDRRAFRGDDHLEAEAGTELLRLPGQLVERLVVTKGVVVEEGQALGPRLVRDPDRVLDGAVAPRAL